MKPTSTHTRGGVFGGSIRRQITLCLLIPALAACDALDRALNVETPSTIPAALADNPAAASLLVQGMLADFDCAFGSYIVIGGLVTDELIEASALANRWPYDRRDVQPSDIRYGTFSCENLGVYVPVSTARFTADDALAKLERWTDAEVANRTSLVSTAAAYSGYSHILLGEGFCSAAIDTGPELTPAQIFGLAEQKFTRAIEAAQAAGSDSIRHMALVGRARARLNLGNYADAAADAMLVPQGFTAFASASNASTRRQNRIFTQNRLGTIVSVGPEYRDIQFNGVPDPRVVVTQSGRNGADGFTPMWEQNKYTSEGSPIVIASWKEARLIVAEAALRGGNPQAAVEIINVLHARAGLPAFSSSNPDEIMAQIIEERRRELFLESHRLWDVNRFGINLDPPAGTPYVKGGLYGNTTCLPLPNVERANNPNI
ncbi:MAG: RagB/SusD family nutrient uptake outer membrane protein [Gemmatimonadetes bacterium]|nr:RagB/SusD family nutrient uptake outer membrane protein [Gemmatimonadota bacterium]